MSTFGQWFHSQKKITRVAWLYGTEQVLIDEVLFHIKFTLNLRVERLDGSDDWVTEAYYLTDPIRLLIVRNADNSADWEFFEDLLAALKTHTQCYLVFLSDKGPDAHVAELMKKSAACQIISCDGLNFNPPVDRFGKQTRLSDGVLWLQSHGPISTANANYLIYRCGGDLKIAKDIAITLKMFGSDVSQGTYDMLVSERVGDVFVNALIKRDKHRALLAIPYIPIEDYSRIVGQLDYLLDIMGVLHAYHRDFKGRRELAQDDRVPTMVGLEYWEAAKLYDAGRRRASRQALAAIDGSREISRGEGLLEALTALF